GLVGGEPCALLLHTAKRAHGNMPIRFAVPGTAPMLQLEHLLWRLFDEGLHGILIRHPVAAGDRVVGVFVEAVIGLDDRRGSSLGRDSVTAHRIDLRYDS